MGLETGTTIASLNASWPLGGDQRSQGDDHIRLVKNVIKTDALSKAAGGTVAGAVTVNANVTIGAPTTVATVFSLAGTGTANYVDCYSPITSFRFQPGATTDARIDPAGTTSPSAQTIMTREKTDARYLSAAGGDVTGLVKLTSAAPQLQFDETDQAGAAGSWRLISNGDIFFLQKNTAAASDFTASNSIWAALPTGEFRTYPLTQLAQTDGTVEIGNTSSSTVEFKRSSAGINYLKVPDATTLRVQATGGGNWASVSSPSGWVAGTCDIRLKENVSDIHYGLDTILALRPVEFDRLADGVHDLGLVSQEVQPIVPEAIEPSLDEDSGETFLFLRKDNFVPILIKALQELTARVAALESALPAAG